MEMVFEFLLLFSFVLGCVTGGLAVALWRCFFGQPETRAIDMPKNPKSIPKSSCDMPEICITSLPNGECDMPCSGSDMSVFHLKAVYISRQGKKYHIRDACLKHKLERYEPCLHCMKDLALHVRKND